MDWIQDFIASDLGSAMLRFLICLVVNWFVIDFLYYKKSHRRDFYFTFLVITIAIYFLVFFMMNLDRGKATMGVGLGLFGIFSIMRYRTDAMPVREMTYLFLVVCLSVVHALAPGFLELLAVDAIVVLAVWICEQRVKSHHVKLVQYDRIELIKPQRYDELVADLQERTGLHITKVDVGGIDFLRDCAVLRITYDNANMNETELNKTFEVRKSQWPETV